MAEVSSNVEFAHKVHEQSHHSSGSSSRRERWIEIIEAVVLAFVAIGTAWSGYQAARWEALSATNYALAGRTSVQAQEALTLAGQDHIYDIVTFNGWMAAGYDLPPYFFNSTSATASRMPGATTRGELWPDVDLQRAADRIVLARYGPAGLIVAIIYLPNQARGRMMIAPSAASQETYMEQLASLVHGQGDFALFKAYMDESGIHADASVCVVAGFVAPLEQCASLEASWRKLLKDHDLDYFHAKDYAKTAGPFRMWKAERKRRFTISALALISSGLNTFDLSGRSPINVAVAIDTADFKGLAIDQRRWLTGGQLAATQRLNGWKWKSQGAPTKPYFLAFHQCVMEAIRFGPPSATEKVHFVFDRQTTFEVSARSLCELMRKQHSDVARKMGDVVYTSKEDAVLLQVADFMAYEAYRYRLRVTKDGAKSATTFTTERLARSASRQRLSVIDAKQMSSLLTERPLKAGESFKWPDEFPRSFSPFYADTGRSTIPMGTKVVRFPR
jgi:hypothetical protein